MSFWTENDVLQYVYKNKIEIAKQYGKVIINECEEQIEGQMRIEDVLGKF